MLDAPTVEERTGRSMANGRVDNPILAIGMVSVSERHADDLFRLGYALDAKSYKDAVRGVSDLAKHLDARHGWCIQGHARLAAAVIDYWLADMCPSCTGIGAQAILGTPVLGSGCPDCRGSGKRPYPWSGRFAKFHTMTLYALQEKERMIVGKMLDKLGSQLRNV